MKILLTGANGYIGKRLLPVLVEKGHTVICVVRDPRRFSPPDHVKEHISVVQADLLKPETLQALPKDISAAYYLVHSMGGGRKFYDIEAAAAQNFVHYLEQTQAKQVIFLSGISSSKTYSQHLASRRNVEQVLKHGKVSVTILRAAIIIGSGSASFEIIRDLVEKLPVMITPRWLNSRCQPIAIRDVLFYLTNVLLHPLCLNKTLEIGGPDILTYKEMLLELARQRHLKRYIYTIPILTPRLSSYWLYFLTSTSFSIARSLVESLRYDAIVHRSDIHQIIPHKCLTYADAINLAFSKIEQKAVISSWKDALVSGNMPQEYMDYVQLPENGVLTDKQVMEIIDTPEKVLDNIWRIGGKRGWYKTDWLWRIRGFIDKMVGGVGLRRGRRSPNDLQAGDSLDFWRVLLADKQGGRLLLYAEMKLPGEAWLQFRIFNDKGKKYLEQLAVFRPKGITGRFYWYLMLPFHYIIFRGMIRNIINANAND
ncbi:MAG: SDR family oxidoreductase [Hymenobacteraceae bacterium]|nr:SDR family oxidoreductase [Hymenobacteraceae bacterium]MDX5396862.1 SDR family oxidoreductase [Hymenobacteraceae bacterium]MDX5512935.1 SDR family oxidoreductase [Hymenobacteraceae bacterium]